jgi:hypothetical protein
MNSLQVALWSLPKVIRKGMLFSEKLREEGEDMGVLAKIGIMID